MSDLVYSARACLNRIEETLVEFQGFLKKVGFVPYDGGGFALGRVLKIAKLALDRCPLQEGDRVRFSKTFDVSKHGAWADRQRLFLEGKRATVEAIDLEESGYTVTLLLDEETYLTPTLVEKPVSSKHVWPGIHVDHLERCSVEDG
jgi:hypothetical protein